MFSYFIGKVVKKTSSAIIMEVGGIGYEIAVSATALARLRTNAAEKLYVHLNVREDGIYLFGFYSEEEKSMFLKLTSISGIGPKAAMSVLSGMELGALAASIVTGDFKTLSKLKGIGKKTAERIILELKEKVSADDVAAGFDTVMLPISESKDVMDAVQGLRAIGFSEDAAIRAVKEVEKEASSFDELINLALKRMG